MITEAIRNAKEDLTNVQRETEKMSNANTADATKIESIQSSIKKLTTTKKSIDWSIMNVRHYVI